MKEQLDRIREMERYLDEGSAAVQNLARALEEYAAVREGLEKLFAYYASRQWLSDFEDDSAGKLPAGLKRGVLSEDGVYDLLTEHNALLSGLRDVLER